MARFYDLYTYEVGGNARDGFEINDVFLLEKNIVIIDNFNDRDIIRLLKRMDFINKYCHFTSFQIEGDRDYTLYFTYRDRPICELRCTSLPDFYFTMD